MKDILQNVKIAQRKNKDNTIKSFLNYTDLSTTKLYIDEPHINEIISIYWIE